MAVEKIILDDFDYYKLFTKNAELDKLLKGKTELDLQVKRLGTIEFRLHPPLTNNYIKYGIWWASMSNPPASRTRKKKEPEKE